MEVSTGIPGIDFYQAMGAEFLDTWRNVR